jgi:hypothetical protein
MVAAHRFLIRAVMQQENAPLHSGDNFQVSRAGVRGSVPAPPITEIFGGHVPVHGADVVGKPPAVIKNVSDN